MVVKKQTIPLKKTQLSKNKQLALKEAIDTILSRDDRNKIEYNNKSGNIRNYFYPRIYF